jgi:hypothetical protein
MVMDRDGYEIYNLASEKIFEFVAPVKEDSLNVIGAGPMTNAHFQNFIDAIRTGEELHSPIHEGNVSATLLHLSNLAWKFGRQLTIDPKTAHVVNDKEAMKMWRREYEPGWEPKI